MTERPHVTIRPDQEIEMEILRRGGDPGQEILPDGWPVVPHDEDAPPPSEPVTILPDQIADMEELDRGGNPGQVDDWPESESDDEPDAPA